MPLSEFIGRTIRCAWMRSHDLRPRCCAVCSRIPTPENTLTCCRIILSQRVISFASRERHFDLPWARRSKFYNPGLTLGIECFYNEAIHTRAAGHAWQRSARTLDASPRSELKNRRSASLTDVCMKVRECGASAFPVNSFWKIQKYRVLKKNAVPKESQ